MLVYCCQTDITWEDPLSNYQRVTDMLAHAKPRPSSLIVLPEMFAVGFSMNVAATTDEPSGRSQAFLRQLAIQWKCTVVGGIVTGSVEAKGSNESVAYLPDGSLTCRYSKLHPFTPGGESDHYRAGHAVELFACGPFTASPFICYDLRFPECFRSAVKYGANLLIVIANWPMARASHWVALLRARAIENQAYVVGVNRAGTDPHLHYPGLSQIFDPQGHVLADAGDQAGIISAELSIERLRQYRHDLPFLHDCRNDFNWQ